VRHDRYSQRLYYRHDQPAPYRRFDGVARAARRRACLPTASAPEVPFCTISMVRSAATLIARSVVAEVEQAGHMEDPIPTREDGLRRSRGAEAPYLVDLWMRSRQASIPAIPPPVHSAADVRAWFAEVVVPTKEVRLVEEAEIPVALLVLDGDWIDQLYVEPDRAGRGFGSRLLVLAKELRPAGLDLWTFQSNHGARRFYERHGFEAVEMSAGDNEEGAPDVHYRWHVPAIS